MTPRWRPVAATLVAATGALILTGCVRLTADTTLNEGETFSQHSIIAAAPDALTTLREQLNMLGAGAILPEGADDALGQLDIASALDADAVREQLSELSATYPGAVKVADYQDEDGLTGVEVTLTDLPITAIEQSAAATPLGAASITREDDIYVIDVTTGAATQLSGAGIGASQLALIEGAVTISASFTFPGLVTTASAGTIAGNTVTLTLGDLLSTDAIHIEGGATHAIDWAPIIKWGLVIIAGLAIIGGATALVLQDRRRRHSNHLPPPRATGGTGAGVLGPDSASAD